MSKKLQVMQICNYYFGNYLYHELFAMFRKMEIELSVIIPVVYGFNIPPNEPDDVFALRCFNQVERFSFLKKQANFRKMIEQKIDISQYQVINAHSLFSGGYAAWKLSKKYGIPYVVVVSNTDKNVFLKKIFFMRYLGLKIMQEASFVIFSCPAYINEVIGKYVPSSMQKEILNKSKVIPFAISDTFYLNRTAPHSLNYTNCIKLIQVGQIDDNKNIIATIKAVQILKNKGLPIELNVVGAIIQSKYTKILEKFDFIKYFGKVPAVKVREIMRESDIFILPSHTESFGVVYPEAMSQGLPILYTKGEGFDGFFPDGTVGYSVNDCDPEDIARKIELAIKNYDKLARTAYEESMRFSWQDIAKQYKFLYDQASN